MRCDRTHRSVNTVIVAIGVVFFWGVTVVTQTTVPQTSWGKPDLQGIWDFRTITPLERPTELGDKAVLTAEEAAALQAAANK